MVRLVGITCTLGMLCMVVATAAHKRSLHSGTPGTAAVLPATAYQQAGAQRGSR